MIRIVAKFSLPVLPNGADGQPMRIPSSPRAGASMPLGAALPGTNRAHEYVWHCHILEHEEHDMMRPLVVWDEPPE
jgi:spore coat protein A